MRKQLDLIGQTFFRWTVISVARIERVKNGTIKYWSCVCSCGTAGELTTSTLKTGHSKSCGCYKRDHPPRRTHNRSKSIEYRIWAAMIQRCTNKNNGAYHDYGGRGITVCEEWLNSFAAFFRDMGERPSPKHEIDRRDNSKGYSKDNCKWVTAKTNQRNKRNNRLISYNGVSKTLAEWAQDTGLLQSTIGLRIDRLGWSVHDALTKPSIRKHHTTVNVTTTE